MNKCCATLFAISLDPQTISAFGKFVKTEANTQYETHQ